MGLATETNAAIAPHEDSHRELRPQELDMELCACSVKAADYEHALAKLI